MATWKKYESRRMVAPNFVITGNKRSLYFNKSAQQIINDRYIVIQYDDDNPKTGKIEFVLINNDRENSECFSVSRGRLNCTGFAEFVGLISEKCYELEHIIHSCLDMLVLKSR